MSYFRPSMTTLEIHNAIKQVFQSAYITKPNHNDLLTIMMNLQCEVNARQANGKRRYPVKLSGYVSGVIDTLYNEVQQTGVEFCYLYQGDLYSTHKESIHARTSVLHDKALPQIVWNTLPNGHIWKGSDKVFFGFGEINNTVKLRGFDNA